MVQMQIQNLMIGKFTVKYVEGCHEIPECLLGVRNIGPWKQRLIEESDYHQIFSAETRNQLKRYADLWSQIPGLAQICKLRRSFSLCDSLGITGMWVEEPIM